MVRSPDVWRRVLCQEASSPIRFGPRAVWIVGAPKKMQVVAILARTAQEIWNPGFLPRPIISGAVRFRRNQTGKVP